MNSTCADGTDPQIPGPSHEQQPLPTPPRPLTDVRLTSNTESDVSSDEERFSSPWNKMMGCVGDTLPSDMHSFLQREEGDREDEKESEEVQELAEYLQISEEEEIAETDKQKNKYVLSEDFSLDHDLDNNAPEPGEARRSLFRPADESVSSWGLDDVSSDEEKLSSPWSKMMRSIGDTLPASDMGSFLQSDEEDRSEAEEQQIKDILQGDGEESFIIVKEEEKPQFSTLEFESDHRLGRSTPEEKQPVRRSVSSPADERLTRRELDDMSSDEERFSSPWSKMMGNIGDTLPVSDMGSFLQRGEGGREEEEEDNEDEQGRVLPCPDLWKDHRDRQVSSALSLSMSDVFSSETDTEDFPESLDWAWVVADLVYMRYGEKMRRLKNNIEKKLLHFRSQTEFRSIMMFKPEPLPEDDIAMLPLLLKT